MHTIMDDTLVRPSQLKVENVFTLERLERSDLDLDTEVHTDLDPGESPDWSVEVSLVDKPECLLAKAPRPLLRHQDGEDVDLGAAGGE